jgi:hypothetical protein
VQLIVDQRSNYSKSFIIKAWSLKPCLAIKYYDPFDLSVMSTIKYGDNYLFKIK